MPKTLRLRAEAEAALIDAFPMLRALDADDQPYWLTAGPVCDFDLIGPLELVPPVVDPETGDEVTPAVIDERCHANLRGPRAGADPDAWAAVLDAAAPFTLTDIANPRRRFAP